MFQYNSARDLVSAGGAVSDLVQFNIPVSLLPQCIQHRGSIFANIGISLKCSSNFLFSFSFSVEMSFGVKSVSHDERGGILMFILANTGF